MKSGALQLPVNVLSAGASTGTGAKSGQRYCPGGVPTLQHAKSSKDKPQSSQTGKVRHWHRVRLRYMTTVGSQKSPPPVAVCNIKHTTVEGSASPDAIQMTANTSPFCSFHGTARRRTPSGPARALRQLRGRNLNVSVSFVLRVSTPMYAWSSYPFPERVARQHLPQTQALG